MATFRRSARSRISASGDMVGLSIQSRGGRGRFFAAKLWSAASCLAAPLESAGNEPADVSSQGLLAPEVLKTGPRSGASDRQQGKGEAASHHEGNDIRAEAASDDDQPQLDPGEDQQSEADEPGQQPEQEQAAPDELADLCHPG